MTPEDSLAPTTEASSSTTKVDSPGNASNADNASQSQTTMKSDAKLTLDDIPRAGPSKIQSLRDNGFNSLESIALSSPAEVEEKTSFGLAGAESLVAWCREQTGIGGFVWGNIAEEQRNSKLRRLVTGSADLDSLLVESETERGGIEAGCLFEAYGEAASTKTQIAHQLCVTVQLPKDQGGFEAKAVFIDTEHTFRPNRIRDIADRYGLDGDEVLRNIMVVSALNTDLQCHAAREALKVIQEHDIGCVVVDSLTANFRAEWSGRGQLADRQQTLMRHMDDLRKVAQAGNCVVFVTNQVMKDPAAGMYIDPTKSVGGDVVAHTSKFRLYLKKPLGKKEGMGVRVARLVDSPDLPVREAVFQVLKGGLYDFDG